MQYVMLALFSWFVLRAIFKPFEGLIGLLAVNMINPGEIWPLLNILHLERLLVLLTGIGIFIRPVPFVYPPLTKRVFWFWGAMFLSVPLSFWPGGAARFALDFGRIILYYFLITNLADTQKRILVLIVVFALLIGWVCGGSLWSYMNGIFDQMAIRNGFERATGLSESNGNPNTVGLTLVSGLPICFLLFYMRSKWLKLMALGLTVSCIIGVLLTGSRTSFSNLCIICFCALLNRKGIKFIPLLMVAAMVTWIVIPQQYKDRYSKIVSVATGKEKDESYDAHAMAREAGYHMMMDYPITGVGCGQFPIADGQKYWPSKGEKLWENPHNLYIQVAAELGIIGVATWLAFMVPFVSMTRRLKLLFKTPEYEGLHPALKNFPRACMFSLAALFIGGMFGHTLYRHTWYMLAGMTVALERVVATSHFAKEEAAPVGEQEEAFSYPA